MKRVKTNYDSLNFDTRIWFLSSAIFRAGVVLMAVLVQHFMAGQHDMAVGLGKFLILTCIISMVVYVIAFNMNLKFKYKYISEDMVDYHKSYKKSLRRYYLDATYAACWVNLIIFMIIVFSGLDRRLGWSTGTLMMCGFSIVINMLFDYIYYEFKCCDEVV